MCVIGLWVGEAGAWGGGLQRLMVGPSLATASATNRSLAERLWLFSAFAVALLSTLATSLAVPCGMNFSRAAASSTGRPTMAWVTRCALRVEWRGDFAGGGTFMFGAYFRAAARSGCLPCPREVAGGGADLPEPVPDHVLRHVDGDVLPAVVDGDGVPDEVREDDARPRPGLDDLLLAALVHLLDPTEESSLDEGAFLE